MSVKIRLARGGSKKRPYYHIVIANALGPRDGRFIEKVGAYNPILPSDHPGRVVLKIERIQEWLAKGAQPTDRVLRFLDLAGLATRKAHNNPEKAAPGKKMADRAKEKAARAEAAAAAAEG